MNFTFCNFRVMLFFVTLALQLFIFFCFCIFFLKKFEKVEKTVFLGLNFSYTVLYPLYSASKVPQTQTMQSKVINVQSDTFGNPIFHEGLQNQPFSRIISVLGCFAQLCQLVAKCEKWTFKVNFLCQKSSESFSIFFSLKNTNLEAHFLLLAFFDKINFLTTLLLKLGQVFDEVAKLGKSTQDAYNPGKWLIL